MQPSVDAQHYAFTPTLKDGTDAIDTGSGPLKPGRAVKLRTS
jgi:hypothetical protein